MMRGRGAHPPHQTWRIRSRLTRHFELRENNQNWRHGSACLKWCPVQSSADCTTNELPTAYEPPLLATPEPRGSNEGDDNAADDIEVNNQLVETSTQGIIAAVIEETETEAPVAEEEPQQTTPEEETATVEPGVGGGEAPEAGDDGTESEIVDVPVDQKLSFGSRRIIKVPCNGNYRPDRSGNCRMVFQ